jgi:Flp pilus assembly protein TadD
MRAPVADLTEAIALGFDDPYCVSYCYTCRGHVLWQMGDFDEAMADFMEAIRVDPSNAQAFYNRGVAYQHIGETSKAEEDLTQARKLGYQPARENIGEI